VQKFFRPALEVVDIKTESAVSLREACAPILDGESMVGCFIPPTGNNTVDDRHTQSMTRIVITKQLAAVCRVGAMTRDS